MGSRGLVRGIGILGQVALTTISSTSVAAWGVLSKVDIYKAISSPISPFKSVVSEIILPSYSEKVTTIISAEGIDKFSPPLSGSVYIGSIRSKPISVGAWVQPIGSFITEKITPTDSNNTNNGILISDIRTVVNGFLSFSAADTQVSVVRDGLKFQFNSPGNLGVIDVGLTKNRWSLRNDFSYQWGVIYTELTEKKLAFRHNLSHQWGSVTAEIRDKSIAVTYSSGFSF